MTDINVINTRIDYLINQFNFFAGTRFKKSTESLREKLMPIASSDSYNRERVIDFFKKEAKDGKTNIYKIAEVLISDIADEEHKEKTEQQASFNEATALNFLGGVVTNMLSNMKLDEVKSTIGEELKKELRQFIMDNYGPITKKIEFQIGERKTELNGMQHSKFETVLKFVQANEPVFLTGPAGSGKNVICKQVADALGLDFYFSNAVTQEYKLTGFTDANGVYHETQFYKAFKNGGVFMLDEMDASIPEVLIILNAAIANRYFDFPAPIGYVEANENFRVVAAGNTYGHGADYEYVGRSQLDAASLDRFAMVRIDYDSRIEEACANGNEDLLKFARGIRKAANDAGVKMIVSYRAISRMAKLLSIMDTENVLETCLIKSMEIDDMQIIKKALPDCGDFSRAFDSIIRKHSN